MTTGSMFTGAGAVWVYESTLEDLASLRAALAKDSEVRMLYAERCTTKDALMRQAASALQFPHYYGHNWAAFEDCLGELASREGEGHVLLVSNASQLLTAAPGELHHLVELLSQAHEDRRAGDGSAEGGHFRLVLHEAPGSADLLRQRLASAGIAFEELSR